MRIRNKLPTIIGVGAALLLGTGLVAVVTDSVTSTGNRVRSPEHTPEVDLMVGHVTTRQGLAVCQSFSDDTTVPMTWSAGTIPVDGVLDPDAPLEQFNGFCVKNVGSETLRVSMRFANVLSTDLGCGPKESEVDATCANGAEGELDDTDPSANPQDGHLQVGAYVDGTQAQYMAFACWMLPGRCGSDVETNPLYNIAELDPGQTEILYLDFEWREGTIPGQPSLRRASQTDRLQWDIRFYGYVVGS